MVGIILEPKKKVFSTSVGQPWSKPCTVSECVDRTNTNERLPPYKGKANCQYCP